MKTIDMEDAVFRKFSVRKNVIVPNVYWGLDLMHECDMFICNMQSRYCTEVEIKISKSDILADKKKKHSHDDVRIARLFFAVPDYLEEYALRHIPERAGLLVVNSRSESRGYGTVSQARGPKRRKDAVKLSDKDYRKLLELGCMRLHSLTKKIIKNEKTKGEKNG